MKIYFIKFVLLLLISFSSKLYSQGCDAVNAPTTINGIIVTGYGTGSVSTYHGYTSCGISTPNNSLYLGQTGAFSYTYNFSSPVDNLNFIINAADHNENFIFTIGSNVNAIITKNSGCSTIIVAGNVITGTCTSLASILTGGDGGEFTINSPIGSFTSFTISGNGGFNGSIFALCSSSVGLCNSVPLLKSTTACTLNTVDLNSLVTNNIPYGSTLVWYNNNNHTSPVYSTPSAAVSGTYYAFFYNVIDDCYSAASKSVNVIIHPLPSIAVISGVSDLSLCTKAPTELLSDATTGGTWTSSNTNIATIDIHSGLVTAGSNVGNTTIIYSIMDEFGCSNLTTTNINVNDCPDPGYVKCNDGIEINEISAEGGQYQSVLYSIQKPITVIKGSTLTLTDVEFMMGTNASITIQNGASLIIQGSHLYGCETMWPGIEVEPGGLIKITGSRTHSSFIEDAEVAIHIDMQNKDNDIILPSTGYFLSVDNTIFNRNNISISIENYRSVTNLENFTYPFFVKNTVFTSREIQFVSGLNTWDDVQTIKNLSVLKTTPYPLTPNKMESPYIKEANYRSDRIASYLKFPHSGEKPYSGIMLNNVGYFDEEGNNLNGITIGYSYRNYDPNIPQELPLELRPVPSDETPWPTFDYNTSFNLFDNMDSYGIYAIKSNLTVVNNTFQKGFMHLDDNTVYTKGIWVENDEEKHSGLNRLNIITEQPGKTPNNAFFDQSTAIRSQYYLNNTINNCDIRSIRDINVENNVGIAGVKVATDRLSSVEMNENHIYNISEPISLMSDLGGSQSGPVDILRNEIAVCLPTSTVCGKLNGGVYTGITLGAYNSQNAPKNTYPINCNDNIMHNVYNGIYTSNWNMKNTIFDNNKVYMIKDTKNFPGEQYGIHVDAGAGNDLLSNRITNNHVYGFNGGVETAIDLNSNSQMFVGCNEVSKSVNGIRFMGGTNTSNKCWDNTFDATGASGMNGLTMDGVNGSDIDMTGSLTSEVCTADNMGVGKDWGINGNFDTYCLNLTDATTIPMNVQNITIYNPDGFGKDDGQSNPYVVSTTGISSINIISPNGCVHDCSNVGGRKGQSFISGMNMGSKAKANNHSSSSRFGGNSVSIANMERIALGNIAISTSDSAQRIYVMQQQLYSSLLADSNLLNTSSILQGFVDSTRQQSLGTIYKLDSLFALGKITTAKNILNGWMPLNNVDLNYYQYYQCLIDKADTINGMNGQDSSTIFRLAFGCPQTDGKVVFAARNLFSSLTNLYIHFPNTCSNGNSNRVAKYKDFNEQKLVTNKQVILYPNPSNGKITIEFPSGDLGCSNLRITDIFGRIVTEKLNVSNRDKVSLQINSNTGIYFLSIINCDNGKQEVKKIYLNK